MLLCAASVVGFALCTIIEHVHWNKNTHNRTFVGFWSSTLFKDTDVNTFYHDADHEHLWDERSRFFLQLERFQFFYIIVCAIICLCLTFVPSETLDDIELIAIIALCWVSTAIFHYIDEYYEVHYSF